MGNKKVKLNIGCGNKQMAGYINIDKSSEVKPDRVVDIEKGLPFPDNYFAEIFSSHCLEHIKPDKFSFVLKEINRVAKPNCILYLLLPFDNLISRTDCDHYRTFSWWSFLPLEENSGYNYFSPLKLRRKKPFPNKIIRIFYGLFPLLKNEIEFIYEIVKKEKTKAGTEQRYCGFCRGVTRHKNWKCQRCK